jgi:hypothetical protein
MDSVGRDARGLEIELLVIVEGHDDEVDPVAGGGAKGGHVETDDGFSLGEVGHAIGGEVGGGIAVAPDRGHQVVAAQEDGLVVRADRVGNQWVGRRVEWLGRINQRRLTAGTVVCIHGVSQCRPHAVAGEGDVPVGGLEALWGRWSTAEGLEEGVRLGGGDAGSILSGVLSEWCEDGRREGPDRRDHERCGQDHGKAPPIQWPSTDQVGPEEDEYAEEDLEGSDDDSAGDGRRVRRLVHGCDELN